MAFSGGDVTMCNRVWSRNPIPKVYRPFPTQISGWSGDSFVFSIRSELLIGSLATDRAVVDIELQLS